MPSKTTNRPVKRYLIRLFASSLLIALMVALTMNQLTSDFERQFENWL